MHRRLVLLAAATALGSSLASLPAQSPQRIIGLTRSTPFVVAQDFPTCAPQQCAPAGFPPQATPFSGGSAWDGIQRGLWVSEGLNIALVDPTAACSYLCPPMPAPNTTPNNPITGMAFNESTRTLFITDQSGVIRWYTVSGCTLTLVSRCIPPIAAGSIMTGCATDDAAGTIYYCAVVPGVSGGIVYVAQQGNPCAPFCKFVVNSCGGNSMNLLQGLAFDACTSSLWATDGKLSVRGTVNTTACTFTETQCCVNGVEPYIGLCVMPSQEASSGPNCTSPPCLVCPTMQHVLNGAPVIGNPAFAWNLVNAPPNAGAVLVLNVGACTPPGLLSPPLCAPLLVPVVPAPLTIGPIGTGGGPGCTGAVSVPWVIPNNVAFCGLPIASQYIGFCSAAGTGFFVSNCISAVITST